MIFKCALFSVIVFFHGSFNSFQLKVLLVTETASLINGRGRSSVALPREGESCVQTEIAPGCVRAVHHRFLVLVFF